MLQARFPRRPLVLRLLLWQRLRPKNESEPSAAATSHPLIAAMSLAALKRMVRIRARAFLRNTRLVGISSLAAASAWSLERASRAILSVVLSHCGVLLDQVQISLRRNRAGHQRCRRGLRVSFRSIRPKAS